MPNQSLNGTWKLRWTDGQRGGMPHYVKDTGIGLDYDLMNVSHPISDSFNPRKWIDCEVPGEVHLDLLKAGIIDDPYIGLGVLNCRWVEEYMWYYRTVFDAPNHNAPYAVLKFQGLDYGTVVYLNGEEIARHANSFYPLNVNVSGKLKADGNVLVVRLESGLYTISEKPIRHLYSATMSVDNLLHKRQWLRKPQSSCQWDWSPRLLNVGIFGDVSLETGDRIAVDMVSAACETLPDLSTGRLNVRLFSENYDPDTEFTLRCTIDGNVFTNTACIHNGVISVEAVVNQPRLWYPTGYGEPYRYDAVVELLYGDNVLYHTVKHTGFRNVQVDQPVEEPGGYRFNIIVNGIRIFIKGGNMVPDDMITAAITRDRYDSLTDLALEANFNFLRIWGGGLYESDDFFDLCDQKGILVWQEFIAACGSYPYDDADFVADVKREAIYNLRRLSHYPSLIIWCGNNEIDVQGVKDFTGSVPPDVAWYHEDLPKLVSAEDPEKYFQPCSPWSFNGESTLSDFVGDQHPWSIGFIDKDYRKYRDMVCRFPNEGGVLGTTSLKTVEACLTGDQRSLHSFAWDIHDNMLENWQPGTSVDHLIEFFTGIDPYSLEIEDLVYLTGFLHGEGLTEYIDSFHSKKFLCGSAVFWMYNDCWPCSRSWTIVDYYHNRAPAFYPVKRAFAPIRVILVRRESTIEIIGTSDLTYDFDGVLDFGITNGNKIVTLKTDLISIPANTSCVIATLPGAQADGKSEIAFAELRDNSGVISRNRLIDCTYGELALKTPNINIEIKDQNATFTSDVLALGVCLDLNGEQSYADNMFDLLPEIPYTIEWSEQEPPKAIHTLNSILINKK